MGKYEIGKCSLVFDVVKLPLVLLVNLNAKTYAQNKAGNGGDEAREEWAERKCAHQQAVNELENTSEENVTQVDIDRLQPLARTLVVLLEELADNLDKVSHHDELKVCFDGDTQQNCNPTPAAFVINLIALRVAKQ